MNLSRLAAAPASKTLLLFLIVGFLTFGKSLTNEYVYDGQLLLSRIADTERVPVSIVLDRENYGTATGVMSWRPLGSLGHLVLDIRLFGHHAPLSKALNIIIHALNAWLLWLLIGRLMREEDSIEVPRLLAAMLFLVHPLTTETVLCTGFRFDSQALLFTLLAALAAVTLAPRHLAAAAGASALLLLLGLLTKEIAVVGLPMIPLLVWMTTRDLRRAAIVAGALFSAFVAFFLVWRLFRFPEYPDQYLGGGGRLLGVANFLVSSVEIYLRKFLLPYPLRVDYQFEPVGLLVHSRVVIALVVLAALLAGVAVAARRHHLVLAGVAWLFFAFLPVSQVVPIPDPVAERFTYVPMAGVGLITAGVLALLLRDHAGRRRPMIAAAAIVLVAWAGLSHARAWDWRDNVTLNIANWERPNDRRPVALQKLAALYLRRAEDARRTGDTTLAAHSFRRAGGALAELLSSQPDDFQGNRLFAIWHMQAGDIEQALLHARRADEIRPNDPAVHRLLHALGDHAEEPAP